MSTTTTAVVHIKKSEKLDEDPKNPIHYVPCKIHLDGSANISQYFLPSSTKNGDLEASFRGHPLKGKVVEVPKGYVGLVLEERLQKSDSQDRTLHVTKKFNEITYWNWDRMPSQNDVFLAALDWIDIANALHSPVDSA